MTSEVSLREKIATAAKQLSIFNSGAPQTTKEKSSEGDRLLSKSGPEVSNDLKNCIDDALSLDFLDTIVSSQSPSDLVQSWIKELPINYELSALSREERRKIAKQRPNSRYDLMPPTLRSNFYFIQFDMDTAKPRFIVRHRSATCNFDGLSEQEKVDLIQVAHDFSYKYKFLDATLSIPLADESQVGVVYSTFYAYIFVYDMETFITLFRWTSKKQTVLSWPSIKQWKTPFWIEDINSYQSINIYIESVRNSASTFTPTELFLMSRRKFLADTPPCLSDSLMTDMINDFTTHNWEAKRIIGVRSERLTTDSTTLLDRWQVLHYMSQLASDWRQKGPDVTCWISLTLSNFFQFHDGVCTPGLMFFPFGVPYFLWQKKEVKKPKTTKKRSKVSLEGLRKI